MKVQTLFRVTAVSPPANIQRQFLSFSRQDKNVMPAAESRYHLRSGSGPFRVGVQVRLRAE